MTSKAVADAVAETFAEINQAYLHLKDAVLQLNGELAREELMESMIFLQVCVKTLEKLGVVAKRKATKKAKKVDWNEPIFKEAYNNAVRDCVAENTPVSADAILGKMKVHAPELTNIHPTKVETYHNTRVSFRLRGGNCNIYNST